MGEAWQRTRVPGIYKRSASGGDVRYKAYWRGPDGAQRTKTFTRMRDAEAHLEDVGVAKRAGAYIDPRDGRVTVEEFAASWLDTETGLRPKTRDIYGSVLRLYIVPELGAYKLSAVTKAACKRLVATLVSDRGKNPPTVALVVRVAHRLFQVAVEEGRIGLNPWTGVKVPKLEHHEPRFLTETEVGAIAGKAGSIPGPRLHPGLRRASHRRGGCAQSGGRRLRVLHRSGLRGNCRSERQADRGSAQDGCWCSDRGPPADAVQDAQGARVHVLQPV
jgi:hypothetical protein